MYATGVDPAPGSYAFGTLAQTVAGISGWPDTSQVACRALWVDGACTLDATFQDGHRDQIVVPGAGPVPVSIIKLWSSGGVQVHALR
jgi:hypothetical protein